MTEVFFDTNVIFYAYNRSAGVKQRQAQDLIAGALAEGSGYTSVQVVGEFFHSTVIRKRVLTPSEAETIIESLGGLHLISIDLPMVRQAMAYHQKFQTSYWDSLILAATKRAGCETLWSEDFNAGQDYDGVQVKNPFV